MTDRKWPISGELFVIGTDPECPRTSRWDRRTERRDLSGDPGERREREAEDHRQCHSALASKARLGECEQTDRTGEDQPIGATEPGETGEESGNEPAARLTAARRDGDHQRRGGQERIERIVVRLREQRPVEPTDECEQARIEWTRRAEF